MSGPMSGPSPATSPSCCTRSARDRCDWAVGVAAATGAQPATPAPSTQAKGKQSSATATTSATASAATNNATSRATTDSAATATPAIKNLSSKVTSRLQLRMDALRHSRSSSSPLRGQRPSTVDAGLFEAAAHGKSVKEQAQAAARVLAEQGFVVCRGGLQAPIVEKARQEAQKLYHGEHFQPGTYTALGKALINSSTGADAVKRDDHTLWLHQHLSAVPGSTPDQQAVAKVQTLAALDRLLTRFGQDVIGALTEIAQRDGVDDARGGGGGGARRAPFARFDDGTPLACTGRSDMMLACYPGGAAAYGKHIDSVDGDGREALDHGRCFTLVYYLNPTWNEATDGGALRLYRPPTPAAAAAATTPASSPGADRASGGVGGAVGSEPEAVDVYPHGDTLAIFRADRVVHEVCASHAPRFACTIWFYAGTRADREKAKERGAIAESA